MKESCIIDTAMFKPVKILLAEDDENDAYFFRRALKGNPRVKLVWHAKDGEEAVQYLSGAGIFEDRQEYEFPDVLVLDLKMPNRNGFEVLEWMQGRFPQLKVGVFSSSEDPQDIAKAQRLGASLYQPKSYDPETFGRFMHWLESLAIAERKLLAGSDADMVSAARN
jgi:DNA-binding NarL/FixJ family response regulator